MGISPSIKFSAWVRKPRSAVVAAAVALGALCSPALGAGHEDGSLRTYIFGHSLVTNGPERSSVPYWLVQLAKADQRRFDYAGQFGFLQGHAQGLPPISQWGFNGAPAIWINESDSFADFDFDSVMMTAANFAQWLRPSQVDGPGKSVVGYSLDIMDWVAREEPGIEIVIYENWPDMATYMANETFPPTAQEFANYNAYTVGAFHDWWREYEADLKAARPNMKISTIPVGSTIAKLLTETNLLSGIPVTDLYIDGAPHGTPNIYFLASLVTYAGLFERTPPLGINVPSDLHPVIRQNYDEIARFIAAELGVG